MLPFQSAEGHRMTLTYAPRDTERILRPGTVAPDFELPGTPGGRTYRLSEQRGKPVVLAFYPADWSPVCSDQLALYSELMPEFSRYGAAVFGISVDSIWSHEAYAKSRNLRFPLLSDFEPKGAVSRRYGAYDEKAGMSERALFVIDPAGTVFWSYLSPKEVNPGADGILEALEELAAAPATADRR
jgi:peroxiredoxin